MQTFETEHYILHYGANTAAERDIQKIAALQEGCFSHICAVLGLTLQLYALLMRGHQADARTSSPRQPQTVIAIISYLREHLADSNAIGDACRAVGISRYTVCRLFKSYVNMSPVNFLNTLRCNEARGLLLMGKCNVSEAARRCGVENLSYFSRLYKRHVGVLPSQEG